MKRTNVLGALLGVAIPVVCFAHSDPLGEVNPYFVERGSDLFVYYDVLTTNGYNPWRAQVHRDGALVEKTGVARGEHSAAQYPKWERMTWDDGGWVSVAQASDGPGLIRLENGQSMFVALDWGNLALRREGILSSMAHSVFSVGKLWAISVERWETDDGKKEASDQPPKLSICLFDRRTRQLLWETTLGRPVRIMTTLVYSPVVEWRKVPVVAFLDQQIRPTTPADAAVSKDCQIVLATLNVAGKQLHKRTVVGSASWNTHIDLHVWKGALWLVYHDVDVTNDYGVEVPTDATLRLIKIDDLSNKVLEDPAHKPADPQH